MGDALPVFDGTILGVLHLQNSAKCKKNERAELFSHILSCVAQAVKRCPLHLLRDSNLNAGCVADQAHLRVQDARHDSSQSRSDSLPSPGVDPAPGPCAAAGGEAAAAAPSAWEDLWTKDTMALRDSAQIGGWSAPGPLSSCTPPGAPPLPRGGHATCKRGAQRPPPNVQPLPGDSSNRMVIPIGLAEC